MTLEQVNNLWREYKAKYELDTDVEIEMIAYDTPDGVEGCFDLFELLSGHYILHLNKRFHIYSENYIRFILFHEFTHFYDFIRSDFESREDLFMYMNSYSEFHACKVTLFRFIEILTIEAIHVDKIQIPGPFKEISIRRLLEESLWRTKIGFETFYALYQPNDFVSAFRLMMYLFGYISLFKADDDMVKQTLRLLRINDPNYLFLYHSLKENNVENILHYTREVYKGAFIMFLKDFIRKNYDDSIYTEEEIRELDEDNYEDFIKELDKKQKELEEGFQIAAYEDPARIFVTGCMKRS